MFVTRGGRSQPLPARQEQMEAQKLCGKHESTGETDSSARQIRFSQVVDLSSPQARLFRECCPANPAIDRSLRTISADRPRKASSQLHKPAVFATTAAFP